MSPNINILQSKLGKALEIYLPSQKHEKGVGELFSHVDNLFNPYGRRGPSIEGAELIIEGNFCREVRTTCGNFKITCKGDIDKLLSQNKRFIMVGRTGNEISTLWKWFEPYQCYYIWASGELRSTLPHPLVYKGGNDFLRLNFCHCSSKDCPTKHIKSSWIEDTSGMWKYLRPLESNPPIDRIKEVFSSIESQAWMFMDLSIEYFSQPGKFAGRLLMTQPAYSISKRYSIEENLNFWNEANTMAKMEANLGIGWQEEATIGKDISHEDIISSHLAALADTPILTPKWVHIECGEGLSEDSFWAKLLDPNTVEAISWGIHHPGLEDIPRQYRLDSPLSGKEYGVIPTHYPVFGIASKSIMVDLGKDHFYPIRTFFFIKKYKGPVLTYRNLTEVLYKYAGLKTDFGKFIKFICRVLVGRMNSYWIKKRTSRLGMIPTFGGYPLWEPGNPYTRPEDGRPAPKEVHFSPITNFLVANAVYAREETSIRWQMRKRKKSGKVLHTQKDGLSWRGQGSKEPKRSLGDFRTKVKPGKEIAILSDVHHSYKGDGRIVNWLEIFKDSAPNATELKSSPVPYRHGLSVFGRLPLPQAHQLLGRLEDQPSVCSLGSKKLLGGPTTVQEVRKGKRFKLAETLGEVNELLRNQEGFESE